MKQWHPIFAKLLRPVLEGYYEVRTNVAVGDIPREADIVVVRLKSAKLLPFQGLWKDLRQWNILEYKGPTVSARIEHLDLLIELGLGIHRHLNDRRKKRRLRPLGVSRVSLWYLVNRIGARFLAKASQSLKNLEQWREGVWCGEVANRNIFLVSTSDLPVETDSLPLHVLALESVEKQVETAHLIASKPELWRLFGDLYASLHQGSIEELEAMAKSKRKGLIFRPEILVRLYGQEEFVRGWKRILPLMGPKEKRKLLDDLMTTFSAEEKEELRNRFK